MLARATLGQTRFVTPGVSPDGRGVIIGRQALLLFPGLDGAVGWLRLYADQDSLDHLLGGMKIVRLTGAAPAGPAVALYLPATSSQILDRAARCARLAGGATFTGSARHFVKYRDERSPFGYDVVDLGSAPAAADPIVHDDDGPRAYQRVEHDAEVDVAGLLFRLSLRRVHGAQAAGDDGVIYLQVAAGLARGVVGYLLRNRIRAEVAEIAFTKQSAFSGDGNCLLVRAHDLPPRLLGSLAGVPGVTLLAPALDNVAVERGWAHPIALTSVASLFPRERFYLFSGSADRVDDVEAPAAFSPIAHFAPISVAPAPRVRKGGPAAPQASARLEFELRLVPTLAPPRRVVATLIERQDLDRLKKLVYALPPTILRGHQIAMTDRGALLWADAGVDVVPLGALLCEAGPGMFIPLGMDLTPRVPVDVLAAAIERRLPPRGEAGDSGPRIIIFPPVGAPFFVRTAALEPLDRRAVAHIEIPEALGHPRGPTPAAEAPRIVNDPVGKLALWGFPKTRLR